MTKYLTTKQVQDEFGISQNTLRKHRAESRGLPFIKIGEVPGKKRTGTVLYDKALIEETFNNGASKWKQQKTKIL